MKTYNNIGDILSIKCSSQGGYPVPEFFIYVTKEEKNSEQISYENIIINKNDNQAKFTCRAHTPKIMGFVESKSKTLHVRCMV